MNNTKIKAEIIKKLTDFIAVKDPKFSKEVIISGSAFEKNFDKRHNTPEHKVSHNYTVSIKASIAIDEEVDGFLGYWLDEEETELQGEMIYTELKDFKTKIEDNKTFRYIVIMKVSYIRQRS